MGKRLFECVGARWGGGTGQEEAAKFESRPVRSSQQHRVSSGAVQHSGNKRGSGKWAEWGFNLKVEPTGLADAMDMGSKEKKWV